MGNVHPDDSSECGNEFSQKEFMNDFATYEFINKNIRVRPPSGATAVDKDEMKSDLLGKGNILGGGADTNQMDDEEKYNQIVNIEMEQ